MPDYAKPPITEAMIQVMFEVPADAGAIEKASKRLAPFYPAENVLQSVALNFNPEQGVASVQNGDKSYRRTSLEVSEIVVLYPNSLIVSQLAPYPGWQRFFERFERDWSIWREAASYQKVQRVSARYINRLDIPFHGDRLQTSDFLMFKVQAPSVLGTMIAFGYQAEIYLEKFNLKLILNGGAVPSPLVDHLSLLLDIDIICDEDAPQKSGELLARLNVIRDAKNFVFENIVTDRARELFNR